jgi:cytochrome P450
VTTMPTIDLLSPATFARGHPHELYAWMRRHDPVHWHPEPGRAGFWAVMRYHDIRFVNMHDDLFAHAPSSQLEDDGEYLAGVPMVNLDPPDHLPVRRAAIAEFHPGAVRDRMSRLREIAAQLVDEVIEKGECDLVVDIAGRMASYVTADLLEIPRQEAVDLYHLVEISLAGGGVYTMDEIAAAIARMGAFGMEVLADRRARPRGDVLSRLANDEIAGARLTDEDWLANFMLLVVGAGDTTRHLISGGMLALFENPDQRRILTNDLDGAMPSAVEEMLRWVTPVVYNRRMAKVDSVVGGVQIRAGDKLAVYYGSGNRDAAAFTDPDQFDVTRAPNAHVAFSGLGAHFCLGAHLARAQAVAVLSEILTRMPDIAQREPVEFDPSNFVSGPKRLIAEFTPGPVLST